MRRRFRQKIAGKVEKCQKILPNAENLLFLPHGHGGNWHLTGVLTRGQERVLDD